MSNDPPRRVRPDPFQPGWRLRLARRIGSYVLFAFTVMLRPEASPSVEAQEPVARFGPWAGPVTFTAGLNLAGRNLRETELSYQFMSDAIFDGCDLAGARFRYCGLETASFRGARLTGASLLQCTTADADFTDAVVENMVHDDDGTLELTPEQLLTTRSYRTKQLKNCRIHGGTSGKSVRFDFRGANLRNAWIIGDIGDTDFTNADIEGLEIHSTIRFEQLASTKTFRSGVLRGVRLSGTLRGDPDFTNLVFERSSLHLLNDARFDGAKFVGPCSVSGKFDRRHLMTTLNYRQRDLSEMRFGDVDLTDFDLSGMNLTGCHFSPACKLAGADLTDTVITDAEFPDHYGPAKSIPTAGLTLAQIQSTWNYKHGRMDGVVLPRSVAAYVKLEAAEKKLRTKE